MEQSGPTTARWTHLALRVSDIDATIDFYTRFTPLELIERREDDDGYGAWLGQPNPGGDPFILVVSEFFAGRDPWGDIPLAQLRPFNHIGIELTTQAEVDAIARQARDNGVLEMEPIQMPDPIGYICMIGDPDGNLIEFSHGQKVYETVMKKWNSAR